MSSVSVPPRVPRAERPLAALAAGLALLAASACQSTPSESAPSASGAAGSASGAPSGWRAAARRPPQEVARGVTAETPDYRLTVNSTRTCTPTSANLRPPAGITLYGVEVTVENVGQRTLFPREYGRLLDSENFLQTESRMRSDCEGFPRDSVGPGEKARGFFVYGVADPTREYYFGFTPTEYPPMEAVRVRLGGS